MRLPRVRFTVRRMMVAAGIAGVIAGLVVDWQKRSQRYRDLAFWQGGIEKGSSADRVVPKPQLTVFNQGGSAVDESVPPEVGGEL